MDHCFTKQNVSNVYPASSGLSIWSRRSPSLAEYIITSSRRARLGHSGSLASGWGFGFTSNLFAEVSCGLTVGSLGRFCKSRMDLISIVTPDSFTCLLRSPTSRSSQLVLERNGPTLWPVRIQAKSLRLEQHPIDAVPIWQEHVFFRPAECLYTL